jgi:Flp pilus assembly protein TadG
LFWARITVFNARKAIPMIRLLSIFRKKLSDLGANMRGSVSVLFGLSIIPMMGLAGVAIDYSSVTKSRTALQGIADAAALYAVSDQVIKPNGNWVDQRAVSIAAAKKEFNSLITGLGATGLLKSMTVEATVLANVINIKICYVGAQPTTTLNIVGVSAMAFDGCSQASSAPPVFVSVYVLADASGSMGVGASAEMQDKMIDKLGCAFACHTIDMHSKPGCSLNDEDKAWFSKTTTCAHAIGVQTRFDIIKLALAKVIDQAGVIQKLPNQFQFAVYKFSNDITRVQKLTGNLSEVKSSLKQMQPDILGAGTNVRRAFRSLLDAIPHSGDGKSASSPKIYLILMTDGVETNMYERADCWRPNDPEACKPWGNWDPDPNLVINTPGIWVMSQNQQERAQAIDPSMCTSIKRKGVTIGTLNTEYVVSERAARSDDRFDKIKSDLLPHIRDTMQKCASEPSLAYYATTPADIDKAVTRMFQSLVSRARLVE